MGKKQWSQKLLSLTYSKLPVVFKYPNVFPLEVQQRGKTEPLEVDLAGKTWVFIEERDPLHAAACVSGKKLSVVKFYLRVPFILFIIPGYNMLCLLGAV